MRKNARKRSPQDISEQKKEVKSKKKETKAIVAKVKPDADITHKLPKSVFSEIDIFKQGCLVHFTAGFWGAQTKLDDKHYGDKLPKEIVKGYQYMISSEPIKRLNKLRREGWIIIDGYALMFKSLQGVRFVAKTVIPELTQKMQEQEQHFWEYANHFVDEELDGYRADMERRFPDFYKSGSFPSKFDVKRKLHWSFDLIAIAVPEKGTVLSPEQYSAQVAREKQRIKEFFNDAILTVAAKFLELTTRLREKLRNKEVFRHTTVDNLTEFIDMFPSFNITGDKQLAECVEQAKKYLKNVDADALRDSVKDDGLFAKQVADNMDKVIKQFSKIHDGELLVSIDI